ncbi:hypothetical protein LCGC14_2157510 [marine sediment metagenome]|uniref:Uncharacterized protein n=1 Tax=marine sediment metagenome TaxID=412755 RepID=A0A0F9DTW5_9ZZZZ
MSEKKNGNDTAAFWNLTSTVIIMAVLIAAGLFSYLAVSVKANAAEISTVKAKAEGSAAIIELLNRDIPGMREQLSRIDRRLYRLETHFKTLPKKETRE